MAASDGCQSVHVRTCYWLRWLVYCPQTFRCPPTGKRRSYPSSKELFPASSVHRWTGKAPVEMGLDVFILWCIWVSFEFPKILKILKRMKQKSEQRRGWKWRLEAGKPPLQKGLPEASEASSILDWRSLRMIQTRHSESDHLKLRSKRNETVWAQRSQGKSTLTSCVGRGGNECEGSGCGLGGIAHRRCRASWGLENAPPRMQLPLNSLNMKMLWSAEIVVGAWVSDSLLICYGLIGTHSELGSFEEFLGHPLRIWHALVWGPLTWGPVGFQRNTSTSYACKFTSSELVEMMVNPRSVKRLCLA